ncbi:uncharacterized protein LOC135224941 [Macrobrachium nipponense]|uniref:uncharacterized protein LOC135224941 n=1 Tax=Macrobrachium nipponense TaxID=159736 RepID=UPI0030C7A708
MCYKKYIIPPEDGISNQDMLQVGPLTSNIVKSKVSTELAAYGNPMITLEKASPVKSSSIGEIENPGAFLDDVTSNESNLDAFLGDSASEVSSSSGGTVSPLDLEEDVLLGESPPPDDTASTADNMEEIMSGRFSSLFDLSFPSSPSEGSLHEKPSSHSEKVEVNTSLESTTLESSLSSTDSSDEKGIPELPVLEEPSYSNEMSDQQPLIEAMLNVSSISEIVAQEASLGWESLDGTLFSSEAANPGTTLDAEASLERASSSDIANPKGNWVGASLGEPSIGDTNPMAFLEEISQGVLHSMEIAYPENSREGELQERTLLQNGSAVMEPPMECETNEMSSPSSGIGDSWVFFDWASLHNPPTEAADVWPLLETEGTLVEGELLKGPPSSFENTDLLVLLNTRNDDSATTSESSSFERSPSPFDFISKESSQRFTFENEFKSITEMNKSSHFSENDASLRDVDLGLPVEMYHVGIEFKCYDLSSIFDDLEMNEMGNPIQTNTYGIGMNENSNALPPLGHASMKIIVNEVTNQLYEDGIYSKAESYVGENSNYWDFSIASPEDYYLDSFDMLELL